MVQQFLDKDSEKFGRKLRLSLESMGPMFIKFGQLLSTRTDLLSINVAKELQKLTDQCKPFSSDKSRKIIESELGGQLRISFKILMSLLLQLLLLLKFIRQRLKIVQRRCYKNIEARYKTRSGKKCESLKVFCLYLFNNF